METERKRLTLDLEPALHRRLKAISQKKGMSMRRYCNAVLDRELAKDESEGSSEGGSTGRRLSASRY